ncbi:MAG: 3-isopropylmalate dehydratase [Rubrivivax sp.]
MTLPTLRGRAAWIFAEENFDIDLIIGIKNIKLTDIDELVAITMCDFDPDFAQKVQKGDLLVAGKNFGYGHPHYPAMRAMRHLGIAAVVAESFSPGFFRGEISMGFPLVTCPGILATVSRWDALVVDWSDLSVTNESKGGASLPIEPLAWSEQRMLECGGLTGYLRDRLSQPAAA